jgi:hypothetical protein
MGGRRTRVVALAGLVTAPTVGCAPELEAPPLPLPSPPSTYEVLSGRCDRGDGPACVEVAVYYREIGDLPGAAAFSQRACDLASPHGCAALARAWERGEGVARDPAAATASYVSACLGGHAPSCISAADGLAGPEARELRRKGCTAEPMLCRRPAQGPPGVDPLDQANVVATMASRREWLRDCYARSIEQRPPPRGQVSLEIALAGDGRVLAVAIRENLRAAPELGACLAEVASLGPFGPTASGELAVVPWRVHFEPDR